MLKPALTGIAIFFALPVDASPIDEHVENIAALSEKECRSRENTYRDLYRGNIVKAVKTVSFVAEGTRLLCEVLRYDSEISRLKAEKDRLRTEAARLETAWQTAHKIDPIKFPDFEGRDKSQQRLLSDASQLGQTMSVLENVQTDLRREARRILNLASDEFDELSQPNAEILLASIDDEDGHDVIIRLLRRRTA